MGEEVIVKGADNLIRVVAPLDVANDTVISANVTITTKFHDEAFDGVIMFREESLTTEYETAGAKICDVASATAFAVGDKVELEGDSGLWFDDVVAAVDVTLKQVTLTTVTQITSPTAIGRRLRTREIVSGATVLELPHSVVERYRAGDNFTIEHVDGTEDETTVVTRTVEQGHSFLTLTAGTASSISPGATSKKKIGADLTGYVLYGTPLVNTTDWGWNAVLAIDSATLADMVVGMSVRAETFFNPAAADLDGRFAEIFRVVKRG